MKHSSCARSAKSAKFLTFCEKLSLSPLVLWDWHWNNWFVLEFIIRSFFSLAVQTYCRQGRTLEDSMILASFPHGQNVKNLTVKRSREGKEEGCNLYLFKVYVFEKKMSWGNKSKSRENGSGSIERGVPFTVKPPRARHSSQKQTIHAYQTSFDEVLYIYLYIYIKQKNETSRGKKKEEERERKSSSGKPENTPRLISSVQRVLLAHSLLAGVITWADPGPGLGVQRLTEKIFLHRSPPSPLENSSSAAVCSRCKSFQLVKCLTSLFLSATIKTDISH